MKKYLLGAVIVLQVVGVQAVFADTNASGCNVSASGYPLYVASGQSSTLTWTTEGCATVWVVNQNGTVVSTASSGSISTGPITGDTPFMVHGELTVDPQYTVDANTFTTTTTFGLVTNSQGSPAIHSAGTNVVSNGTIYFLDGTSRRPYTSAGAFTSYGFNNWNDVQQASSADLDLSQGNFVPPMDGSLINDHGTIWVISKGQKWGFTNSSAFTGLGYSFNNVIPGDASFMPTGGYITTAGQTHPIDTVINEAGTDYLVTSKGIVGIPSQAVFASWGYSSAKVVAANNFDPVKAIGGTLDVRPAGQLSAGAYFVDNIYGGQQTCPAGSALTVNGGCGPVPAPTPVPVTTTAAPTTVQALTSSQLAQCGTNTNCFNGNAQTCTLSEATMLSTLAVDNDYNVAINFDSQIQGTKTPPGLCEVYLQVKSASIVVTPAGTQDLMSQGQTTAEIQQGVATINADIAPYFGYQMACYYMPSDGVAFLQDLEQGNSTALDNLDTSNCTVADAQGKNVDTSGNLTLTLSPDDQRISDIGQLGSALELYYNAQGSYPTSLAAVVPKYLNAIPIAPGASGACTAAQNTYTYTQLQNGANYSLAFCLGSATAELSAGTHAESSSGIQ